jgi:hypothetical protein
MEHTDLSVLCRQRTKDFSVGEETEERSKQQGVVSGVRAGRGSPASAQGGGLRRPRSGVRAGSSGVRAPVSAQGALASAQEASTQEASAQGERSPASGGEGYPVSGVRKQG